MLNIVDLTDKKIIVTGASSGIGRTTAIVLSKVGAKLILIARRETKLQEVIQDLEGEEHTYYCADLSQVELIEDLVKKIISEQGRLDGMVYAAGITKDRPLAQFKPEIVKEHFDINFFGFMEFVRQICKKGRYNDGLRIVGISSIASLVGTKAHEAYAASKAAMDGAVRCMSKELAEKGIAINTVAPAMTATEMYYETLNANGEDAFVNKIRMYRQYGGIVQPIEVANVTAFLLSSAASAIKGICLPVDNGYTSN